jgi:hypothetical protein
MFVKFENGRKVRSWSSAMTFERSVTSGFTLDLVYRFCEMDLSLISAWLWHNLASNKHHDFQ